MLRVSHLSNYETQWLIRPLEITVMPDLTKEAIGQVLNSMLTGLQAELFATPETELDKYLHFCWDDSASDKICA